MSTRASDISRYFRLTEAIDELVSEHAALGLDGTTYLDKEIGPHPNSYGEGPLDEHDVQRLLQDPIDRVIDELINRRGGSRAIANLTYFADRRLEVIRARPRTFAGSDRGVPPGRRDPADRDARGRSCRSAELPGRGGSGALGPAGAARAGASARRLVRPCTDPSAGDAVLTGTARRAPSQPATTSTSHRISCCSISRDTGRTSWSE